MRVSTLYALVGLISLTGNAFAEKTHPIEEIVNHYTGTWFASAEDKVRCGHILRELSGGDMKGVKERGTAIDQALRDARCLDEYSHVYGASILPTADPRKKMDTASIDRIGSYLFVYINTFEEPRDALVSAVKNLDREILKAVKTVVIDVRGNQGGYIHELHKVLDAVFSPQAGVHYLEPEGKPTYGKNFTTSGVGVLAGLEIRILTDSQTASSSEWMIETLCYEWYPEKCLSVGTTTYGKSRIQCFATVAGVEIKLTCGEWFLPERHARIKDQSRMQRVQGVGLTADRNMRFESCDRYNYTCIAEQLASAGL